jgi:two-component system phosphate regulon sensor histidine kinase PhoR
LISKILVQLFGLLVLLLTLQAAVLAIVFKRPFCCEVLWSGVIALALALPVAAWAARRFSARLQRMISFARRISSGELSARLDCPGGEDRVSIEAELNQSAERLGKEFAEIESRSQELSDLLDSMQEAVVAITPDGLVRWSNAQMRRIAGIEIRVGRPLVHSVRDPELLACVKAALELRTAHSGRAATLTQGRIFEIHTVPMTSGGVLAVLHDITRIEAAEYSRRQFVANVSHEWRTPLTSIQGYVETLIEDPGMSRETSREFLGIVLKNASSMNRITVDLLALASVESPDYQLKLQPTRASALLQDAIDSAGGMVVDSGVVLESAGAPESIVMSDSDAMNQVFGNLVENALRYGKAGKRILLEARLLESEVEFSVQDFGPGIASEHLSRIFERFYRIDKARSRESGGTGLGLAIVKHIVQAHGGRIWAESELGRGTTFHFTLPLETKAPQDSTSGIQQ